MPYTSLILLIALATLVLAQGQPRDSCPEEQATFGKCQVTREQVIADLFARFAEPGSDSIDVNVLYLAWERLLTPAMRRMGGSPAEVIRFCDINNDGKFTRQELLGNKCGCMENCMWATRVNLVCARAKTFPNWRDVPAPGTQ